MESSEQFPCDGSLDLDDSSFGAERIDVGSSEDCAGDMSLNPADPSDVLAYLDTENAKLVLDSVESEKIELSGKCLKFSQRADEVFLCASPEHTTENPSIEHALSQSISENSSNIHTLLMQCGLNNLPIGNAKIEMSEKNGLQNFNKNETCIEQAQINSNSNLYSSEAVSYLTDEEEEDTTEMVFIPTTSKIVSLSNTSGYLHLSGVVHPTGVVSKRGGTKCARKVSEESAVSQKHANSYSGKMVDEVSAVNKENSNSLHEEHMAFEVETSPSVEESSSVFMPPQDIDPAVSVIHASTSSLGHDGRTKSIQVNKSQAGETDQPDIALPAIANVAYLESTNLKESLNSELFSESSLIDESSNHSALKSDTDSSNKGDTVTCETTTVKEIVVEDANESIHLTPELPCENTVDDCSKQKDSINCTNDSNTSVDFDQSQNLENKIFAPSSKNYENELAFTNSEEICSEMQTCTEGTFLSLGDNSDSKSSFFSASSWSKDHMLKINKSVSPNKEKIIDEYDFDDSSSEFDQELNRCSSLDWQPSDMINSNDISSEVEATKVSQSMNSDHKGVTGNLTFKGILTPVTDDTELNENPADGRHSEIHHNNSQYLFDQGPQHKEEHSSNKMLKSTIAKCCRNKQNSAFSKVNCSNENSKFDGNIVAVKNVNIDNATKNDILILNIDASYETIVNAPQHSYSKRKRVDSAKSLHQTCSRKKRDFVSNRSIELFSDDLSDNESYPNPKIFVDNEKEQIMLDEYGVAEDGYVNLMPSHVKNGIKVKGMLPVDVQTLSLGPETENCLAKVPDTVLNAENSVRACDVNIDNKCKENNSIFSNIATSEEITVKPPQHTYSRKKKISEPSRNIELFSDDLLDSEPYSTPKIHSLDDEKEHIIDEYSLPDEDGYINLMPTNIKNKIISSPVDESVISLKPGNSDLNLIEIDMDIEGSVDMYHGTCLMETAFKPVCTKIADGIVPKVSPPDVPKAVSLGSSLEKRMQTPSCEKISSKVDSFKSGQVLDKKIESSPVSMKNLSDKRNIREKVINKKEKTLRNSENFHPSSISMVPHKSGPSKAGEKKGIFIHKWCCDDLGNYNIRFVYGGLATGYYCAIDKPSSEESTDFQYTCSYCEFGTNKVNNLIAHLKYFTCRSSAQILNKRKKQQVRRKLSRKFSKGSVSHHQYAASLPTTSKALQVPSNRTKKLRCHQ